MKLQNILLGQAVRFGKISGPDGGSVYGLNLTKACEERYGFLQSPRVLADFDLSKGVTFLHGYFQNQYVIDRFQVYENGMLAEAKVDTDICDAFLDDVLQWVTSRGGIKFDSETTSPRFYLSQLEMLSDIELNHAFSKIAPMGRRVADVIRSYNQITPDLELSGVSFGSGEATSFKFERREGPSVPRNVFFASARLRTKDHLSLLDDLEGMLRTSAS